MVGSAIVRKARRDYSCSFCTRKIYKFHLYTNIRLTPWSHAINESFYTWRAHNPCWTFWNDFHGIECDYEWDDGDLSEKVEFERIMKIVAARKARRIIDVGFEKITAAQKQAKALGVSGPHTIKKPAKITVEGKEYKVTGDLRFRQRPAKAVETPDGQRVAVKRGDVWIWWSRQDRVC